MTIPCKACWLFAALCHLSACAVTEPGPAGNASTSAQGGPAPATLLSTEQIATVRKILAGYRADALDATQARALLDALRKAGLVQGPALHRVMADLGFSAKHLAQLADRPPEPARGGSQGIVTPSGRTVPPRP